MRETNIEKLQTEQLKLLKLKVSKLERCNANWQFPNWKLSIDSFQIENLKIGHLKIPNTPQHTDSHLCTRPPIFGAADRSKWMLRRSSIHWNMYGDIERMVGTATSSWTHKLRATNGTSILAIRVDFELYLYAMAHAQPRAAGALPRRLARPNRSPAAATVKDLWHPRPLQTKVGEPVGKENEICVVTSFSAHLLSYDCEQ